MKITPIKLKLSELVKGYIEDESTNRVVAWDGKLEVRPEYQREFVYDDKKRDAVINSVLNKFPLNSLYFVDRKDGTYEVLDGQQRIISICRFVTMTGIAVKIPDKVNGGENRMNWPHVKKFYPDFLDYELDVYICDGTEQEKLDWFQVINIAGEVLEKQEILNAIYHSAWLTDAKSAFSMRNCPAHRHYGKYFSGDCIRQKYLETAFRWKADDEGVEGPEQVAAYMQKHAEDANANELWRYVERVFEWADNTFGPYDKLMKGVEWGLLYNRHKHDHLDPVAISEQVKKLLADEEVQRKKNVYQFVLEGDERLLNLRQFSETERRTMYERQDHKCAMCGNEFEFAQMHGDHVVPWARGGKTTLDNGQMLCRDCNFAKGARE